MSSWELIYVVFYHSPGLILHWYWEKYKVHISVHEYRRISEIQPVNNQIIFDKNNTIELVVELYKLSQLLANIWWYLNCLKYRLHNTSK